MKENVFMLAVPKPEISLSSNGTEIGVQSFSSQTVVHGLPSVHTVYIPTLYSVTV